MEKNYEHLPLLRQTLFRKKTSLNKNSGKQQNIKKYTSFNVTLLLKNLPPHLKIKNPLPCQNERLLYLKL